MHKTTSFYITGRFQIRENVKSFNEMPSGIFSFKKIITTREKEKDGNGLSADLHQGIGGVIEKMDYMWNG